MKKYLSVAAMISLFISLLFLSVSHAPASDALRFEQAQPGEVQGTFSVILFDNAYGHGIQRLALLDREGDDITIEPYALVDEYKIIRNLPAAAALKRAHDFVSVPTELWSTELTRISTARGDIIGYELRPLYNYLSYGTSDVLNVSYRVRGKFIYVHIRLKEEVDRIFRGEDR